MAEFAHICLIPAAAVLGVGVVIAAEWPIDWLIENEVGTKIVFPKKPSRLTARRYEQLKETPKGGKMVGRFERFLFLRGHTCRCASIGRYLDGIQGRIQVGCLEQYLSGSQ